MVHPSESCLAPAESARSHGWVETPIGDVVVPSEAQLAVDASADYRVTGIYSFGKGLIDRGWISGSETSYKTLTRLHEGNIVISKLNGWEGAVAVVDRAFDNTCVSGEYPTFIVHVFRLVQVQPRCGARQRVDHNQDRRRG